MASNNGTSTRNNSGQFTPTVKEARVRWYPTPIDPLRGRESKIKYFTRIEDAAVFARELGHSVSWQIDNRVVNGVENW